MKKFYCIVALFLFILPWLNAQQSSFLETFHVGFIGDYVSNRYSADFTHLPGCPDCGCPVFRDGKGDGFAAGAFVRVPLGDAFSIGLAFTYNDQSGTLSKDEHAVVMSKEGVPVPAVYRQTIDATIHTIGIEPRVSYSFYDAFHVSAAARFDIVNKNACTQIERIIEPKGEYVFSTGSDTRTIYSGVIPGMRKILASLSIGLGYDFAFGFISPLLITPEIAYSFGLMNIIQDMDWKINAMRAGLRISFPLGG
jgi:hypothetical protein